MRESRWKSRRGSMRESRGKSWGNSMYWAHGRIIITVCAVTFCDMIGIFNLVSESSVTAFACVGMFLCLMDFDTIF